MQQLEFSGLVTAGKLPPSVSQQIMTALAGCEGKRVIVSIREQKKRRSLNQNRYMFGVVIKLITQAFRDAGNAVDDEGVFSFMKSEVWKLRQVYVTPEGEVLYGPGSTRLWTTHEMEVRLEQARGWAAETLGIAIPLPHEDLSCVGESS
jgi:hypothetical protein